MTAAGLAVGAAVAARRARRRGLDPDRIWTLTVAMTLAGIAGARLLFLAEQQPADLLAPGTWLGNRGFSFYGGLIGGATAAALLIRHWRLPAAYLDVLAYGFPAGMAVGRVGDVINGEHFGQPTDAAWGVRYTRIRTPRCRRRHSPTTPAGSTRSSFALALTALLVLIGRRLRQPGALFFAVIGLYATGRFFMFFYRDDSDALAAGLNRAQFTSAALAVAALAGVCIAARGRRWPPSRQW